MLRSAMEIDIARYNGWKNLGICLEHQGLYEEAAESYLKAIVLGHGEPRSVKHLLRLVERHPSLKEIPVIEKFLAERKPDNDVPRDGVPPD